jgi:eukaryotic-like serine/threonine-protein kinase
MGNTLRLTEPTTAAVWYRKSMLLAKDLTPPSQAEHAIVDLEESLAAVLVKKEQAAERLRLLQDANRLEQKLVGTEPDLPLHRQRMIRSYCRLSDAELSVNDLPKARQYADLSLPLLNRLPLTSPDLTLLRDVGLCYESLGNVQRQIAMSRSSSTSERQTAHAEEREWYSKSDAVWNEWKRGGAATPESERERFKVEHLLASVGTSDRKLIPVAQ